MRNSTRIKKRSPLRIVLPLLVVAICAGAAALAVVVYSHHHPSVKPANQITIDPVKQQAQTDAKKGSATANQSTTPSEANQSTATSSTSAPSSKPAAASPSASTGTVAPVISYAGEANSQIELHGYVPGVFEDGGSCVYTMTQNSKTITKQSSGFQDVNKTTCQPVVFPSSDMSSTGTWRVTLTYGSATSHGTSQTYNLQVQ